MALRIPRREHLFETGASDPVGSYFGLWAPLMRRRLAMVVSLMGQRRYRAVLELGYGSGILLNELTARADGTVTGVDSHARADLVRQTLALEGITRPVTLLKGDVTRLELASASYDLVVAVSLLEHIPPRNLGAVVAEIARIAAPDADIVVGFPTKNFLMKGIAWLYRWDYDREHPSSEVDVLAALDARLVRRELKLFPAATWPFKPLYVAARFGLG